MMTNIDWGTIFKGAGALAGAWGNYETQKKQNKLTEEKLNYEKSKDTLALAKSNDAQTALEAGFENSLLTPKKKKDTDPLATELAIA